ncbi:selenide, water dikinase SelD [bacterium]|nr:selenide, water dikinase SelD [bacterium]
MSPAGLAGILDKLPKTGSTDLLVGMDTMDDAGVFRLSDDLALVQSVDFFFPAVNDPRTFGRIVAANSLSDIWAMGGTPVTAMNLLAYPAGKIPSSAIEELLTGGSEKLVEAGVVLAGGHTLELEFFIYGMSVTGTIDPRTIRTNARLREGDALILTKPLGTDIYCDAHTRDGLSAAGYRLFVEQMERLNKYASETLASFDVSAMTDVTGFGLLGHSLPMARNAGLCIVINEERVPRLPDIPELRKTFRHQQVCKCRDYILPWAAVDPAVGDASMELLSGAQTSGGLLAAVRSDQAERAVQALREVGDTAASVIGHASRAEKGEGGSPIFLRITP